MKALGGENRGLSAELIIVSSWEKGICAIKRDDVRQLCGTPCINHSFVAPIHLHIGTARTDWKVSGFVYRIERVGLADFFFFFGIRIYIPRAYNKGTEADTYHYVVRL